MSLKDRIASVKGAKPFPLPFLQNRNGNNRLRRNRNEPSATERVEELIIKQGERFDALEQRMDDQQKDFDAFKKANDESLDQKSRSGDKKTDDTVTRDKVDKINDQLSERDKTIETLNNRIEKTERILARPGMGGGNQVPEERQLYRRALNHFARTGDETFEGQHLRELEKRAYATTPDADGGYMVQPEIDNDPLNAEMAQYSPLRKLIKPHTITTGSFKKPVNKGGTASGWVGETVVRPETASSSFDILEFTAMEVYAQPSATQTWLDDGEFDAETWLTGEVSEEFGSQEDSAFTIGDGVDKPKGFASAVAYAPTLDSGYTWGNPGYIPTGDAAGFAATNPGDTLIDLTYALKAGHRNNAVFAMAGQTIAEVRKMKDPTGQYLWQPPMQAGQPANLLGYPLHEFPNMPALGAAAFVAAFANFQKAYKIVDRIGFRVLRDPYTAKPFVLFYCTKRVAGGIQNFEAIKLLRCEV